MKSEGKELKEAILYFGCRKQDSDYIYKSDINTWKQSGIITELKEAFSRETANKVYV